MRGHPRFWAEIFLLAGLFGCTSTPPPSAAIVGEPTLGPTSVVEPTDCRTRIEAVNLADGATIDAVDECRFTAGGAQAGRDVLVAGGSRDQLWAAVWIYSSAASDPAPLMPILTNADASLRAIAGATVMRLGERAGLTALIASLSNNDYLAGALPPVTVAEFAAQSLSRLVAAAGAPPMAESLTDQSAVAEAWTAWLATNEPALTYDRSKGEWLLP